MLAALFLCLQAAWGLAPFLSQQETIDRVINGVEQRSYFVMFNQKGPNFGHEKEKLQGWLRSNFPEVNPEDVQHIYHITDNFRGFSIWANRGAMDAFLAYEGTDYVEEDQVMRIAAPFTQRGDYGQVRVLQKGTRNLATVPSGQYSGTTYPSGGADTNTWDWTTAVYNGYNRRDGGAGSKIWIVDTGVVQNHQEFVTGGRSRVETSRDFVNSTGTGTDCNGHGTHCAGSAAGQYRGLSFAAAIGNVRVLDCGGSGSNANVVAGFDFVANNQAAGKTNILSASLGGGASTTSDNAINNGARAGVVPVVAAGNNNNANACNYSPARASEAITVAASNKDDARASFSNSGSCVTVFAPGQSIHSSYGTSASATTSYSTLSGTSMATPLTAGCIGLFGSSARRDVNTTKNALRQYGTANVITGTLLAGTPNLLVNGNWN
jgi:hypothetical protein